MIENLPKKQRQLLALGILVILIGLLFTLTVTPLLSLNTHYLDRIDQLERRLRILDNKVSSGDSLRQQKDDLETLLNNNGQYLKSNTDALAAADLQGVIKRLSRLNSTEVLSTQPLPAITEGGFSGAVLKVRMRGKLDRLVRIFHSIESGKPYLFVNNVSIRSRIQHASKVNYAGGKKSARMLDLIEILDVEFEITGFMPRNS